MMGRKGHAEVRTRSETECKIKAEPAIEIYSTLYEKDEKLLELDSDLQEDFYAVIERMKFEETETAGQNPDVLSGIYKIPKLEQSLEFSELIPESAHDIPSLLLCRLCATPSDSLVHMFDQNDLQNNIIEKIQYCLPIRVKDTDTLPKKICQLCLGKLELCYQFHKTVTEAEKRLLIIDDVEGKKGRLKTRSTLSNELQIIPKKLKTTESEIVSSNSKPQREKRTTRSSTKKNQTNSNSETNRHLPIDDLEESGRIPSIPEFISEFEFDRYTESDGLEEKSRNDKGNCDIIACEKVLNGQNIDSEMINCRICNETFQTAKECLIHWNIHVSTNYFPCCLCGEILLTEKDWYKHKLLHEERKILRGEMQANSSNESLKKYCRKASVKSVKLKQKVGTERKMNRKRSDEAMDSKKSPQNVCQKQLRNVDQLTAREKNRGFRTECQLCGKKFLSNFILDVHQQTDCRKVPSRKERKFPCMYCGKRFHLSGGLNVHLRTHTGERPYSCDICGQVFINNSNRKCHRRIHTGERPFKCSICKKAFARLDGLKVHSFVHSDNKPYKCPLCPSSFTVAKARDMHVRAHTAEPYKCEICGICFLRKDHMTHHRKTNSCLQKSTAKNLE